MNILNLNFDEHMPDIINTIIEVYGKKNEQLIKEQEKKYIYTTYVEPDSALNYHSFLKNCKVNEACIKYLERIGVLDSSYELKKSYQKFPVKINKLLDKYLATRFIEATSNFEIKNNLGICSFRKTNQASTNETRDYIKAFNQISYLNRLKDNKKPLITIDNYEEFKQTEEYKILYEQIQTYLKVFEEINIELRDELNEIAYLEDYYNEETSKQKQLYKLKMLKLYERIRSSIPRNIKKVLDENFESIEEKVNFLLNFDPNDEALIENFSSKSEDNLRNKEIPENEKRGILIGRTSYLKSVGCDVEVWDYRNYDEIINKDEIKKCLPSEYFVNYLIEKKETCKERIKKTCIYQNPLLQRCIDDITSLSTSHLKENSPELNALRLEAKDALYNLISKGNSCNFITSVKKDGKTKQYPIILQLVTKSDCAMIDYVFLHELVHALEFQDEFPNWKTGFDCGDRNLLNSYNKKYRKYERMNETITDMIVEKIRKILLKKEIYIAENKKLTDTKVVKNRNTDNILKKMLYPLFDKVEEELLDSRLTGDTLSFVTLIGLENFQALNDSINHVDFLLSSQELREKLKRKAYQDPTVIEYNEILEHVELIYQDIDEKLESINNEKPKVYSK